MPCSRSVAPAHRPAPGRNLVAVASDDFELLYDEDERSAIDAWRAYRVAGPRRPGIAGWRHTSASGAMVAAVLLGIRDALEDRPREEEILLVVDDPGEPDDLAAPFALDFDPDDPAATVVTFRAWAL